MLESDNKRKIMLWENFDLDGEMGDFYNTLNFPLPLTIK